MVQIIFRSATGETYPVSVEPGYSVMEAAYNNSVPGIEAECGGAAACATCHVYVDPAWSPKTGSVNDIEDAMLFMANERQPNSRLSCQMSVTEELDGLIVDIADNSI